MMSEFNAIFPKKLWNDEDQVTAMDMEAKKECCIGIKLRSVWCMNVDDEATILTMIAEICGGSRQGHWCRMSEEHKI